MKTFAGCLIVLAIMLSQPGRVSSQELTPEDQKKLELAEKAADDFVGRFRQTLDFGTVWREFHMSDISCTVKGTGAFSQVEYERLKLDNELLERYYVAFMNFLYLMGVHDLSVLRIGSSSVEDADSIFVNAITPKEIRLAGKRSVYVKANGKDPKTARDLEEMIVELRRLGRLYRKHMPRNAMRSKAWHANNNYLQNRSGSIHLGVFSGNSQFCIPETTKYYIVDRGLFYFYIIEETGKMKVAGLAIDRD